jgi:hypothetical protein
MKSSTVTSRRRGGAENDTDDIEAYVARIDAGESAWSADDVEVDIEFGPLNVAVPVTMSPEKYAELNAEAKELGIGPAELLRVWAMERLRQVRRRKSRSA